MESTRGVRFGEAFWFWLKLGFISFGGPAGQIAIMHQELVERRKWISEGRFLHALNYCMVLPGPEAQQLATYIGWLMHKTWGGIVAGGLFVLPSFLILVGLSWIYLVFGTIPWVAGIFLGVKAAVLALVLHAAVRIGYRSLDKPLLWVLAGLSLGTTLLWNLPFPIIVASAATVGFLAEKFFPGSVLTVKKAAKTKNDFGPALIDDETPTPQHAVFHWRNAVRILVVGLLLWAVPMGLFAVLLGWDHTLTQMGWFFTLAALLTFGGAYAVLPFVFQGAVGHYGWLTTGQMIEGLGLGETTPGPLIMVVTFVGFVGGWTKGFWGPDALPAAGLAAAGIVTWVTFLPSFLFIFLGGPVIESTHKNPKVTAPLTAVTASVVGVIVNLAILFGTHVIWPQGFTGAVDWRILIVSLLAVAGLFGLKTSPVAVIGVCATLGLGMSFVVF